MVIARALSGKRIVIARVIKPAVILSAIHRHSDLLRDILSMPRSYAQPI